MLRNEVFVDDHRYWQFSFSGGPILESRQYQWLTDDGRLIFTQHGPPDDDGGPTRGIRRGGMAGRHASDETGEVLAVVPNLSGGEPGRTSP